MPNPVRFLTPALSALAVLLAAPKLVAQPTPSRPNILVVVADDWGWGHAGALGDPLVKTPTFDQLAKDGVIFQRAYCASPSCTASRASLLTGQMFYRLEEASVLHGPLRKEFPVYPEILESAGYAIGLAGKGLGPGDFKAGGRDRNPAGPAVESFEKFLDSKSADQPFCFWFGSNNPHRPYNQKPLKGTIDPAKVPVPAYLPDAPEVREDLADYYAEVQAFDSEVGRLLEILKQRNLLNNTLVVVTSDNGIPFPRGKLNLYDSGVRMPTVVSWPAVVPVGRVVEDFASQTDFAPTFLEAAGLPIPKEMTGRSLLEVLKSKKSGLVDASRTFVVTGRERHGGNYYPSRAISTKDYVYIRNCHPDESPKAGDPGPTVEYFSRMEADPSMKSFNRLFRELRPAEELYVNASDPDQLTNVAGEPAYAVAKKELAAQLDAYLLETKDPRATGQRNKFDELPDFGKR